MPAKTRPVKGKRKKQRPVKADISERELERKVEHELEKWKEISEARGRIAQTAYNSQDEQTQETIERMMDRILAGSNGVVKVVVAGTTIYRGVDMHYLGLNAMYLATEILKDLAFMDIQVANYEFPEMVCTECGVLLKPVKKKRKKRG